MGSAQHLRRRGQAGPVPMKPLAYGLWVALLVPLSVGLTAAVTCLVDALIRVRRRP